MKRTLMILNILAIVVLGGATAYLFMENRDLNTQLTQTDVEKRDKLVAEIEEVLDLPDEIPEVVVVTDPETFKTEYNTFDNVENGDNLLIFRKARLGVLYRQSEQRVIKTTSVVIPIAVELIGSQKAIDDVEDKLVDFGTQISVTKKVLDGVTQSFVFDVDADQQAEVDTVATQLKYEIGTTLPAGITPAVTTEIVVVVEDPAPQPAPESDSDTEPDSEEDQP